MSKNKRIKVRDKNVVFLWRTNLFKRVIPNKKKKTKKMTKKEMVNLNDNN